MQKRLFRKVSLERLSSPEQLDLLTQVTTPKGWVALIAFGLLLAVAIVWGIYGSIPTKVRGQGILIKTGGVFDIVSLSSGRITAVYVDVGQTVENGQIVARIEQRELIDKIKTAKAELRELKADRERIAQFGTEDIRMQTEYMAKERANLEIAIDNAQERLRWFAEKLESQKQLLEEGLITKQTFLSTKRDIHSTKQEIEKTRNELKQISIKEFELKDQKKRELINSERKISQTERRIISLEDSLEISSRVVSPYTGHVLEITAEEGQLVDRNRRILTLELVGEAIKDLEAVVYVPSTEGKKIQPGMKIQVSPTTVNQEEYGFILGMVTYVSEFPATSQGMMRVLENEDFVRTLLQGGPGPPTEIYADLVPDPTTASGYKWSSPKGPPIEIHSGTRCTASVTVLEQPPVSLAIPLLKKHILGIGEEPRRGTKGER
jgi:HlyD family secretion protein